MSPDRAAEAVTRAPGFARDMISLTPTPRLTAACRALLLLSAEGFSAGIGACYLTLGDGLVSYMLRNDLEVRGRQILLLDGLAGLVVALAIASILALAHRRVRAPLETLVLASHRLAPASAFGFLPLLFQWPAWLDRPLGFLCMTLVTTYTLERGLRVARSAEPLFGHTRPSRWLRAVPGRLAARFPRAAARAPIALVAIAASAYAVYFTILSIWLHQAGRSGVDLALENHLLHELIHGGGLCQASSIAAGRALDLCHRTSWLAPLFAPLYALFPRAEALLSLQSILIGAAAIPLFLVARSLAGSPVALTLALSYLLYAPLHAANLDGFHYLSMAPFFLFGAFHFLLAGRDRLGAAFVVLSLLLDRGTALPVTIFGLYLWVSGARPRLGVALALVAGSCFAAVHALIPSTQKDLLEIAGLVARNPWFSLGSLETTEKLTYLLRLLVPLALLPLRRGISWLFLVPGVLTTLVSTIGTGVSPGVTSFETSHWTAPLFFAAALGAARLDGVRRAAVVAAVMAGTLACSHQYGSIFLPRIRSTSHVLPTARDLESRTKALREVVQAIPPRASVAATTTALASVSSRHRVHKLSAMPDDVEYLLFSTKRSEWASEEIAHLSRALIDGSFGVTVVSPPFALARRGHTPSRNQALLRQLE